MGASPSPALIEALTSSKELLVFVRDLVLTFKFVDQVGHVRNPLVSRVWHGGLQS